MCPAHGLQGYSARQQGERMLHYRTVLKPTSGLTTFSSSLDRQGGCWRGWALIQYFTLYAQRIRFIRFIYDFHHDTTLLVHRGITLFIMVAARVVQWDKD